MRKNRKKGFTMVELMVVLIILSIIAAVAVPFFINYWRKAEFRKNEENAKTVYLAAESTILLSDLWRRDWLERCVRTVQDR